MNAQLFSMLYSLQSNLHVLNSEMERMTRTEQFNEDPAALQLVAHLRESYVIGLENLKHLEARLQAKS